MNYTSNQKYGPMDPEFYMNIINKFATEENKEKAKSIITKQYLECNFYRTRICDFVFNKDKTDSIIRSYRSKSNWIIGEPDEHSNWFATNKNTSTKKRFRLCDNDLCKDAHNHSSIRKAKCIFNVFGVCDKGATCKFSHESFNINETNIPLCSGKDYMENGDKKIKVFFYLHTIRIFKYAVDKQNEKTYILNINNQYFNESESNTKENIQKRIDGIFNLLTIYYNELNTIFNNNNEISITLFLHSIVKNILDEVVRNIYLYDHFETIYNHYINVSSIDAIILDLIQFNNQLNNIDIFINKITNSIKTLHLLDGFNNDLTIFKQYCTQKGRDIFNLLHNDSYYNNIKPYIGKMVGMWIESCNQYIFPALQDEKLLIDIINESLQILDVNLTIHYRDSNILQKQVESFSSDADEIITREYNAATPFKEIDDDDIKVDIDDDIKSEINVNTKSKINNDTNESEFKKTEFLIPLEIQISCNSLAEFKSIGKQLQSIKGIKVSPILFE